MEKNFIVDPLKSFLSAVFTANSGFSQPAYNKQPTKRVKYASNVLHSYQRPDLNTSDRCVFTGKPPTAASLDVTDELPSGRAFRQHVPLTTGEDIINFHPYGNAGLPVSGEAVIAIHALPLGCAKVSGRLLAIHSDAPETTIFFAKTFLEHNRQLIQAAQIAGSNKLDESPRKATTLLVEKLLGIEAELSFAEIPLASLTAYYFSNMGQSVSLEIYHLPIEITLFLRLAKTAIYRTDWNAICDRGWQLTQTNRKKKGRENVLPRFNCVYDDLFALPDQWPRFVRRYFLRIPLRRKTGADDPRSTYSFAKEPSLVSWKLTEMFLKEVTKLNAEKIERLKDTADRLADYILSENDRKFFHSFLTAPNYGFLRSAIIRVSVQQIKKGRPPVISFEPYIELFEEGEETPQWNWRLTRDLLLIRMIDKLYHSGWIQEHKEELPEPELETESV
ncbi:type I-B CRISPR-associated protein Cas8b1/Cst1 [bacterium]|nr:type I-B CRISPR-associated protein Cas8b1/Cst1 [bacterium]